MFLVFDEFYSKIFISVFVYVQLFFFGVDFFKIFLLRWGRIIFNFKQCVGYGQREISILLYNIVGVIKDIQKDIYKDII